MEGCLNLKKTKYSLKTALLYSHVSISAWCNTYVQYGKGISNYEILTKKSVVYYKHVDF